MSNLAMMESLQKRVSDSIREKFIEMIPAEAFDEMVARASEEFWTREAPEMVKKELRAHMEAHLKSEMNQSEWREQYRYNGYSASEAMKKVAQEAAPELMEAFFSQMVMNMVMRLRSGSY